MIFDELPPALRPLVQPIDTWFDNRRLGLLFEGQFNSGKLMVCSMNLSTTLSERLVARQMRYSILQYMRSPAFSPALPIDIAALKRAGILAN